MKKVILFMAGILASMMLNAQSRWSVTPEAGLVVNKENEGTSVTLGFKAGAGVLYQLKEGVGKKPSFGLKSGVYILMQKGGYHPMSWGNISTGGGFSMDYEKTNVESTRYYLQLPVMAHWGFKLCDDVRLLILPNMESLRHKTISYKTKQVVETAPEDWVIFENTQEAIVDKETWELVQKLRQTVRRTDTIGEANPLTGLVYCADCGAKMRNHRSVGKPLKSDPTKRGKMNDRYGCSTHANAHSSLEVKCTEHGISTEALRTMVLETIRYAAQSAVEDEEAFRQSILKESQAHQKEFVKEQEKKLKRDKERCAELDNLIQSLYESNFAGKISDKRFKMMSEKYEQEQAELEQTIAQAEREISAFQTDSANVDSFISLAKKYTDYTELTTPMLNEFVEKILVHEAEKVDGERVQEVEIYLNYIGKMVLPEVELTPEEIAELEKLKEKRRKAREAALRCYYKKKEQKQKEAEQKTANPPDDAA